MTTETDDIIEPVAQKHNTEKVYLVWAKATYGNDKRILGVFRLKPSESDLERIKRAAYMISDEAWCEETEVKP